jgi:hypothetical protein
VIHTKCRNPEEDDKIRADGMEERRGGNAANTACVLGQFESLKVEFFGVMNTSEDAQ